MRLHHLRSGEAAPLGSRRTHWGCWGVQEGAKGSRTPEVSPRAASSPKGEEFTPGHSSSCSPCAAKETDQIQGS